MFYTLLHSPPRESRPYEMTCDVLFRACWASVQERVHLSEISKTLAIVMAVNKAGDASDSMLNEFIEFMDPTYIASLHNSIENMQKTLANFIGKKIQLIPTEEAREAITEDQQATVGVRRIL